MFYVYVYIYVCINGLLLDIILNFCLFWLQVSHLSTILLTKINNINLIKKRV